MPNDNEPEEIEITQTDCTHEFLDKEYASQPYGTCMCCGKTVLL